MLHYLHLNYTYKFCLLCSVWICWVWLFYASYVTSVTGSPGTWEDVRVLSVNLDQSNATWRQSKRYVRSWVCVCVGGKMEGGTPRRLEATGAASHTKSAACRACNWPLVSVAHLLLSSALPAPARHLTRCLLALLLLTISARTDSS